MARQDLSHVSFSARIGDILEDHRALVSAGCGMVGGHIRRKLLGLIDLHAEAQPHELFLAPLLRHGDPLPVKRLFRHHGAKAYRRLLDREAVRDVIAAGNIDMLRLLHAQGFLLEPFYGDIVLLGVEGRQTGILIFHLEELSRSGRLFEDASLLAVVNGCTPETAPLVAGEMRVVRDPRFPARPMLRQAYLDNSLKAASALLCAGAGPGEMALPPPSNRIQLVIAELIENARSNHSRLALLKKEPCLVTLLGRPADATFHGQTIDWENS